MQLYPFIRRYSPFAYNKSYAAVLRHVHHTPCKACKFTGTCSSSFIAVQTSPLEMIHFHPDTCCCFVGIIYYFGGCSFLP